MNLLWQKRTGRTLEYDELASISRDLSKARRKAEQRLSSGTDLNKRLLRERLVEYAQAVWEGRDPCPDYKSPLGKEATKACLEFRKQACCPDRFRAFRERFAPHVRPFLFPEQWTSGTVVNGQLLNKWLDDPVPGLLGLGPRSTRRQHSEVDSHAVFRAAEAMLVLLTDWSTEGYYRKGRGGYVTAWVQAATDYHVARIEHNLDTGAIVEMRGIDPDFHHLPEYSRLRELRVKVGLHTINEVQLPRVPTHPDITRYRERPLRHYIRDVKAAQRAQADRRMKVKFFNKFMRATCNVCPETTGLFFPPGLEGLVSHMEKGHARKFWETDDVDPIGKYLCTSLFRVEKSF